MRGVGGGDDLKRLKHGFIWCGEGSSMVEIGGWSAENVPRPSIDLLAGVMKSCTSIISVFLGNEAGKSAPPLDQKALQKSNSLSDILPLISTHPSNQFSQETLHDGTKAILRSTKMNFGCMTLKGLTKTLFTTRSTPPRSSGPGKPKFGHDFGPYIWPLKLVVWNSFWNSEMDEKHSLTSIFWSDSTPLTESVRNNEAISSRDVDLAQKHVTIMTSCLAVAQIGKIEDRTRKPVPIRKDVGDEVVMSLDGSVAQ